MARAYKVLVTGAFNSGKTEFVRTASDIPVVSTERPITDEMKEIKDETTVAMDYGQVSLGDVLFHLFGTPGQPRFAFMRDILSQEMDALLLLVDSTNGSSLTVARRLLRRLNRQREPIPFLIPATKQDLRRATSVENIASSLDLDSQGLVVPCDARKKSSVNQVLTRLSETLQ